MMKIEQEPRTYLKIRAIDSGIQTVVGILREHPSDGDPECVIVVLERIQQLYTGELTRVIRAEGHYRKTGYDEPLKADLQFDHLLR
jgi:hypothetical protein